MNEEEKNTLRRLSDGIQELIRRSDQDNIRLSKLEDRIINLWEINTLTIPLYERLLKELQENFTDNMKELKKSRKEKLSVVKDR